MYCCKRIKCYESANNRKVTGNSVYRFLNKTNYFSILLIDYKKLLIIKKSNFYNENIDTSTSTANINFTKSQLCIRYTDGD